MCERRMIDFVNMDEIMPDVERLLEGHSTAGTWTLAQILHHLATSIRLTSLGRAGASPGGGSEAFRRQFFETRRFPDGVDAPHRRLIPPAESDLPAETEALREAIARFTGATGPFPAHPLLGPLTKEEWSHFHCIHCAHHLGFAVPLPAGAVSGCGGPGSSPGNRRASHESGRPRGPSRTGPMTLP